MGDRRLAADDAALVLRSRTDRRLDVVAGETPGSPSTDSHGDSVRFSADGAHVHEALGTVHAVLLMAYP